MEHNSGHGGPGKGHLPHAEKFKRAIHFPVSSLVHDSLPLLSGNSCLFHTTDKVYVEIPSSDVSSCPFLSISSDASEFPYPAVVLRCLVHWVCHYGMTTSAESPFPTPCVYPDFQYVVNGSVFDSEFHKFLFDDQRNSKHFLQLLNAAGHFGVKGLEEFLIVCLGCMIRDKSDSSVLNDTLQLPANISVSDEELMQADVEYSWVAAAIEPTVW